MRQRRPLAERFWEKVDIRSEDDCWLWQACGISNGYGTIFIGKNPQTRRGVYVYAHRLSWELAYGAIPDGLYVCHTCDVPACVNPQHLFLGTAADNTEDMLRKGRANRSPVHARRQRAAQERANRATRNAEIVGRVRSGESLVEIANDMGLTRQGVQAAFRRIDPTFPLRRGFAPRRSSLAD